MCDMPVNIFEPLLPVKVKMRNGDQHECTQCEYKYTKKIYLQIYMLRKHKSPPEERERSGVPV